MPDLSIAVVSRQRDMPARNDGDIAVVIGTDVAEIGSARSNLRIGRGVGSATIQGNISAGRDIN